MENEKKAIYIWNPEEFPYVDEWMFWFFTMFSNYPLTAIC